MVKFHCKNSYTLLPNYKRGKVFGTKTLPCQLICIKLTEKTPEGRH